ncbi:MAG TPA: hypothetical protein VD903_19690 [Pseudonocardia sp.]|nr:hypothetical protein [Pseudonocardia sp.]
MPAPNAGHGAVIVVSIALAAGLVAGSTAIGGGGLLTLLVLLIGCFALIVPVAVMVTIWRQVRRPVRVLLALGLLACLLLLAVAVPRIAAVAPLVL